jgi:hypothetical protein
MFARAIIFNASAATRRLIYFLNLRIANGYE